MTENCLGCGNEIKRDEDKHHMECPTHGDEYPLCAACADKFSFEHENCVEIEQNENLT